MRTTIQLVALHADAPPKPLPGAQCNGCGVCCAAEPCPAGWLLFRRRGACPALVWQGDLLRYGCGLLLAPKRYLRWLPARWEPLLRRWIRRVIAAGRGCDSDAQVADDN